MLIAWQPRPERLARRLALASADELTSPPTGVATNSCPPTGFARIDTSAELGTGGETLDRLSRGLMSWELHRAAGMVVAVSENAAKVGVTIVNAAPFGPLTLLGPCRVVAVLDEPDCRGFVYGTLPGHPLIGEEQFAVERDHRGRTRFRIRSFSRPVGLAARWPALARAGQRAVNRRYLAAAQRIAA